MPKISMAEKEMMADVLNEDLQLINAEISKQFAALWDKCRDDIAHELGFDDRTKKIEELEEKIRLLREEIGTLQKGMKEYEEHPSVQDYIDVGVEPPKNRNGFIYNHDRYFHGIPVNSMMDILIVKRIKEICDPSKPIMMLGEIAKSAHRALVMSGTYEEARKAYETFYNLDFRRYGVNIPRRLEEIKKVEGPNLMSAKVVPAPALPAPDPTPGKKK
jgi:hypothetical protein